MSGTEKVFEAYRTAGFRDTERASADECYRLYRTWLPSTDRPVLDLGCGGGEFLEFLRELGYEAAEGIDFSAEQIERCRQRGLTRVSRQLDTRGFLSERIARYGCVVMNDVLEHVPKPECISLLTTIRQSLAPGGGCIIKVPNMANVFGLVARYLDFTHEVGFTESSLRQVLIAAGFDQIEIVGVPVELKWTPKRIAYWMGNRLYLLLHRAAYVAAVGVDAPTILTKLIVAHARARE